MATKEELKDMVLQFKVTDLQLLLGFAGQNKHGRKTELQKRAVSLIYHKMSIPLEMKIRQMYRDIIPESNNPPKTNNGYYSYDKYDNYCMNPYSNHSSQSFSFDNYHSSNYYGNNNLDNCCDSIWNWSSMTPVSPMGQEAQSSKFSSTHPANFNFKVPDERNLNNIVFNKLPFFKYKSPITSLTPLMPKKHRGDSYEFSQSFSLSQQQISLLNWSKKNEKESRYQVQVRICILDEFVTDVSDDLPLALTVKVNDKNCQLPPAIPSTNKQGMLLKRMDAPINVTSQTSRKNCVNTLFVSWSVASEKLYGIVINLVKKYSADELIDKLKEKGERDPEQTKKYLSDKLGEQDDDIAATSLKVSMICPLGKILMSLPVRATTCNHLQCFDGALYIKMNDVKSTWQCPVCNQPCFYENLFIDGYFVNVLKNHEFSSKVTEIQIEVDGSVTTVVQKKRTNSGECESPPDFKKIKTEGAETQCEFIPEPLPSCSSVKLPCVTDIDAVENLLSDLTEDENKKKVVLVDLTESDSESEQECMPLNLKKYQDNADTTPFSCLFDFNPCDKKAPPVYDIDDFD